MQTRSIITLASLCLFAVCNARADIIYLVDGREVRGDIESQAGQHGRRAALERRHDAFVPPPRYRYDRP